MYDCKLVANPYIVSSLVSLSFTTLATLMYRNLVSSFQYLILICPNITFVLNHA